MGSTSEIRIRALRISQNGQVPLFVFFLSLTGIVSARQLLSGTPYAVLLIFVTAAILTPPDVVSQVFLATPMIALYLVGVGVALMVGLGLTTTAGSTHGPLSTWLSAAAVGIVLVAFLRAAGAAREAAGS